MQLNNCSAPILAKLAELPQLVHKSFTLITFTENHYWDKSLAARYITRKGNVEKSY